MRATNLFGASQRTYPEVDSLFFKFQGPTQASLQETSKIVNEIVKKHGATGFALARSEKEAKDLWADRKNALYASLALLEGARGWSTDVWSVLFPPLGVGDFVDAVYHSSVPVSRLPDLVYETKKDIQEAGLMTTIVGHVGDGQCPFLSPVCLTYPIGQQAISILCFSSGTTKRWQQREKLSIGWLNEQ